VIVHVYRPGSADGPDSGKLVELAAVRLTAGETKRLEPASGLLEIQWIVRAASGASKSGDPGGIPTR
jgi:hypothetical protein